MSISERTDPMSIKEVVGGGDELLVLAVLEALRVVDDDPQIIRLVFPRVRMEVSNEMSAP